MRLAEIFTIGIFTLEWAENPTDRRLYVGHLDGRERLVPTRFVEGSYEDDESTLEALRDGRYGVFGWVPLESGAWVCIYATDPAWDERLHTPAEAHLFIDPCSGIPVFTSTKTYTFEESSIRGYPQPWTAEADVWYAHPRCEGHRCPGCWHSLPQGSVIPGFSREFSGLVSRVLRDADDVFEVLAAWSRAEIIGIKEQQERARALVESHGETYIC